MSDEVLLDDLSLDLDDESLLLGRGVSGTFLDLDKSSLAFVDLD